MSFQHLFCHAGIPQEISSQFSISDLNELSLSFFNKQLSNSQEEKFFKIISGDNGILTNREFGNTEIDCNRLKQTLQNLNAEYMVVGHTVQRKINTLCENRLWRVDVGISRAFGENRKHRNGFLLIYDYGKKFKIF